MKDAVVEDKENPWASSRQDGQAIAVFDVGNGKRISLHKTDKADLACSMSVSSDCKYAVFGQQQNEFLSVDLTSGVSRLLSATCEIADDTHATDAEFTRDGSYLLNAKHGKLVLRNPVTFGVQRVIDTGSRHHIDYACSADGLLLAVIDSDEVISLWDVPTGTCFLRREGHLDSVITIDFAGSGRVISGSFDLTSLLWDMRPKDKPTKPLWEALSGEDGKEAYRATWAIANDPKGAELLRNKIAPAKPAAHTAKWLAELGSDKFFVREAAAKGLSELGHTVEPVLRSFRAQATAEEVRTRLDGIIGKLHYDRSGIEITHARAVAAMEIADTDISRKILAEWATGSPDARLTVDAKAALLRMGAKRN